MQIHGDNVWQTRFAHHLGMGEKNIKYSVVSNIQTYLRGKLTATRPIITFANNLDTMQPRLRILHCFEYGKYGMTPTIERAEDVLHA